MSNLSLVVLAAGLGSRYGGLKQLDGVGPNNEVIMEYSLYDAYQAGVSNFVFVIRESFQEAFQEQLLSRLPDKFQVRLAYQALDDLPAGYASKLDLSKRTKPWGTGQAVWAARHYVPGPFMAINADDYYGSSAFKLLALALGQQTDPDPCMVSFYLKKTLSASGTVSRGVCDVTDGKLNGITERVRLHSNGEGAIVDDDSGLTFSPEALVSMNCWGFGKSFFDFLKSDFLGFLQSLETNSQSLETSEYYLPAAVDRLRSSGKSEVLVKTSPDSWLGVTYPEDRALVTLGIQQKISEGKYPARLWS